MCRRVIGSHVPADCQGFVILQADKAGDLVQALFSVPQREGVPERIAQVVLPHTRFRVPAALGFGVVHASLTHVMQQPQDRHGFLLLLGDGGRPQRVPGRQVADRDFPQTTVNVQAVNNQATGESAVVLGSRRGLEKVRFILQPLQQFLRTVAVDAGQKQILEMLGHGLQAVSF